MKKILSIWLSLIIFLILGFSSCSFAPGSYPYAEEYKLKISESELIMAIDKFNYTYPEFNVPEQTQLKDGRTNDRNDHWYHLYFYYKDENQIIYAWVRQKDKDITSFALVSINQGLTLGNWKEINKDFSHKENKAKKQEFEERILNPIKKIANINE
jgi:hypothetical protein